MINYIKRASKLENYWLSNLSFREEIYSCLAYCGENYVFWTNGISRISFEERYADLQLTGFEISVFASGLFLNRQSYFIVQDSFRPYLTQSEIKDKNTYFNSLGMKLGCSRAITHLFHSVHQKEKFDDSLFRKLSNILPNLTLANFYYFRYGLENIACRLSSLTKEEQIYYLAGHEARNENLIRSLSEKNIFLYAPEK